MKTKSNKKQSVLLIVFLVAILTLSAIFFTACMSEEEAFEKYGKEKAFMYTEYDPEILYSAHDSIEFYLDPSLEGDYMTAAKHAIAKANAITDALTITGSTVENDQYYKIEYSYQGMWSSGAAAVTHSYLSWAEGHHGGKLWEGYIELYGCNMDDRSLSDKKRIVMHEIGHVLGLEHPNDEVQKYSVMHIESPYSWFFGTDYGAFDKANIKWMYEEYKPSQP